MSVCPKAPTRPLSSLIFFCIFTPPPPHHSVMKGEVIWGLYIMNKNRIKMNLTVPITIIYQYFSHNQFFKIILMVEKFIPATQFLMKGKIDQLLINSIQIWSFSNMLQYIPGQRKYETQPVPIWLKSNRVFTKTGWLDLLFILAAEIFQLR